MPRDRRENERGRPRRRDEHEKDRKPYRSNRRSPSPVISKADKALLLELLAEKKKPKKEESKTTSQNDNKDKKAPQKPAEKGIFSTKNELSKLIDSIYRKIINNRVASRKVRIYIGNLLEKLDNVEKYPYRKALLFGGPDKWKSILDLKLELRQIYLISVFFKKL